MRLVDYDPRFLTDPGQGLMLMLCLCPQCGHHGVGAPVTVGVKEPGRWKITSQDFNTLTMEPSLLAAGIGGEPPDCPYHFRIENGEVIKC